MSPVFVLPHPLHGVPRLVLPCSLCVVLFPLVLLSFLFRLCGVVFVVGGELRWVGDCGGVCCLHSMRVSGVCGEGNACYE